MKTQTNSEILLRLAQCRDACHKIYDQKQMDNNLNKLLKCTELCKDAAEICTTASSFVGRNSYNSKKILRFSSSLLHRCADELEKYNGFEALKECSDVCRSTAQECAVIS